MNISTDSKKIIKIFGILVALSLVYTMYARSGGYTGVSEDNSGGCSCHGSANSNTKLLASTNDNFTFEPGEKKTITINVENSGKSAAGINASVKTQETGGIDSGTLSAGTGTKVESSEITHSSTKDFSGISTDFEFDWTAPNEAGEYYLLAVGNAVNKNGGSSGDEWNWMDPVKITVQGLNLTAFDVGGSYCLGSTVEITWDEFGVDNVTIELSTNGGSSFDEEIASSVSGTSFNWTIPNTIDPGNEFKIRISDTSNNEISDESANNFSITSGVEISEQPQSNVDVCTSETLLLSVTAIGSNLQYQWFKDGTEIIGADESQLSIENIAANDAGIYSCEIDSQCGNMTSENSNVNVISAPQITSFPLAQSVCEEGNIALEVEATGSDLSYQWLKDGLEIAGANSAQFEILNADQNDAGTYKVVVTSSDCGSIETDELALNVLTDPNITIQPTTNSNLCDGSQVDITIDTEGSGISYTWKKDDLIISNSNSKTLTIDNFSNDDLGEYVCVVTNQCASIESSPLNLNTINSLPEISSSPQDKNTFIGSNFTISVVANGENLSYAWFQDGNSITGESGPELQFLNTQLDDAGEYYCEVTNDCGSVQSEVATITVEQQGDGPVLTLSQNEIDFGDVKIGELEKILIEDFISNSGDQPLIVNDVLLSDNLNGIFALSEFNSTVLQPGEATNILVEFLPNNAGEFNTKLLIETDHGENREIAVSGNGVEEAAKPIVETNINLMDYGSVTVGSEKIEEFTLTNTSQSEPAILNSISFIDDNPNFALGMNADISDPINIQPEAEYIFEIVFRPIESDAPDNTTAIINFENAESLEISLVGVAVPSSVQEIVEETNVYPLPSSGKINFDIQTKENGEFSVYIFSNNGSLVKSLGNYFSSNKFIEFNWDGKDVNGNSAAAGVYFLIIENNFGKSEKKFIIK